MINTITLEGRITRDLELKGEERKYLSNTLAVYGGRDKEDNIITFFFDFKCFLANAVMLYQKCKKGSKIVLNGSLKQDKWQDVDGNNKSKVLIYVENICFPEETKQEPKKQEEQEDNPSLPW